jgi:hypothetical protein
VTQNPYQPPTTLAPTPTEDRQGPHGLRPLGIWLLSGLHLIVGLVFLTLGIGLLIAAAAGVHDATGPIQFDWIVTLGLTALAAYAIASGVGLWRGSRWGWWLSAFYYVAATINFAGEGTGMVWRVSQVEQEILPFIVPAILLRMVVHVLLVLYLFKRSVRDFFGLQSLSMVKAIAILTAITFGIGVLAGFVMFLTKLASR